MISTMSLTQNGHGYLYQWGMRTTMTASWYHLDPPDWKMRILRSNLSNFPEGPSVSCLLGDFLEAVLAVFA
jgi:hypothetical protein